MRWQAFLFGVFFFVSVIGCTEKGEEKEEGRGGGEVVEEREIGVEDREDEDEGKGLTVERPGTGSLEKGGVSGEGGAQRGKSEAGGEQSVSEQKSMEPPDVCPVQVGCPEGVAPSVERIGEDGYRLTLWACPGAFIPGVVAIMKGLVYARLEREDAVVWQAALPCRTGTDEFTDEAVRTEYLGYDRENRMFIFDESTESGMCAPCAPKDCRTDTLFGIDGAGKRTKILSDMDEGAPGFISDMIHMTTTLRKANKLIVTTSSLQPCHEAANLARRFALRQGKLAPLEAQGEVLERGIDYWPCADKTVAVYDPDTGKPTGASVTLRQHAKIEVVDFKRFQDAVLYAYKLDGGGVIWSEVIFQECVG